MEKKIISEISEYLRQKVKIDVNKKGICAEVKGKQHTGFTCCVQAIVDASAQNLQGEDPLSQAQIHHWLSYCVTQLFRCPSNQELHSCLQYINEELCNKVYLCGFKVTVADIIIFLALHPFAVRWTAQQKEEYINISRWMDLMQQDPKLRTSHTSLVFSRTLLYQGNLHFH
ncbi:aaRS-interacting multifunctional protein 3 [Oratosquilla oratoria]|uniref:aaRS-interacting multifunctional protein 3 n=1 Tax=Oratosquilla oratoria TaxID=337810 RepID=UPI003F761A95